MNISINNTMCHFTQLCHFNGRLVTGSDTEIKEGRNRRKDFIHMMLPTLDIFTFGTYQIMQGNYELIIIIIITTRT